MDDENIEYRERVSKVIETINDFVTNWDNQNDAVSHFIGGMKYAIAIIENKPDIWGTRDGK